MRAAQRVQARICRDNCGLIQVSSPFGRGAAQPTMTSRNAVSKVIWKPPLLSNRRRLRETWIPPGSMIARGSGDHHVIGLVVQGKMPLV